MNVVDPIEKIIDMWDSLEEKINNKKELIGAEPITQKNGTIFGYRCEVCHRSWKINQKRNCLCI